MYLAVVERGTRKRQLCSLKDILQCFFNKMLPKSADEEVGVVGKDAISPSSLKSFNILLTVTFHLSGLADPIELVLVIADEKVKWCNFFCHN